GLTCRPHCLPGPTRSSNKRREFITLIGGAVGLAAGRAGAAAGRADAAHRYSRGRAVAADRQLKAGSAQSGLRRGAESRGRLRFAAGQAERYPGLAAELVELLVELIVALGTAASVAAKRATEAIPIMVQTGDPV